VGDEMCSNGSILEVAMFHVRRTLLPAALVLFSANAVRAQSVNPSGHWDGAVHVPGNEFPLEVDLAKDPAGKLIGTFGNPADRTSGLPLSDVSAAGTTVRFAIKTADGGAFTGTLSSDGKQIAGNFVTADGLHTLPFSFTRTGDAKIAPPAKSAPVGKELEGKWTGTLDVQGVTKQLVLTLTNHPDSTSTGTIGNVADGLEISIASIVQRGNSVTLDIKALNGIYAGALNAQGEIVGTLSQGGLALPLTFRRAAP
jgi:hypothetical protein